MSACKTGCVEDATGSKSGLCGSCWDVWATSPERGRYGFYIHNGDAARAALVDFCTRIRLERLNGGRT